jgi:carboxymethylenebutenolidase
VKKHFVPIFLVAALVVTCMTWRTARVSRNSAAAIHSVLPDPSTAKLALNSMSRHREWVMAPSESGGVLAFVVYPERSDKAPVAILSDARKGASDWARATADQVAAEGYIAVVPDVLTGTGPKGGDTDSYATPAEVSAALDKLGADGIARRTEAVRRYAIALPAADGQSAALELDATERRIQAVVHSSVHSSVPPSETRSATFPFAAWPGAMAFLNRETNNHPVAGSGGDAPEDHSAHIAMLMAQSAAGRSSPGGIRAKAANLPAGYFTAQSTLANSKQQKGWVDIPMGAGANDVKLHTWIEYPSGVDKAPVAIVMQHASGADEWLLAIADQLAVQGFIAVTPDIWSGAGPNGGNRDSFQYVDDAMKATAKITADETQRRFKIAWDYAMKLPRANGKSATIGFCAGGGSSFRFAAEVPELSAAVVFYGTPPTEAQMANIKAPVIGFYGENDARVTSTVEPTIAAMKKLGKLYEPHVYPKATHTFVMFQEIAANAAALNDSWPRAIAFMNQYTR